MSDNIHKCQKLEAGTYEDRTVRAANFGAFSVFVHDFKDGAKYFQYGDLWLSRKEAYDLCGAFYCGLFAQDLEDQGIMMEGPK